LASNEEKFQAKTNDFESIQAKLVTAEKEIHDTTQMLITAENVLHNTTQTLVTAEKLIHDTTQKHAEEMDAFKTAVARDNLLWCEEFVQLNQTHRDTDGNDDEWMMMMRGKRSNCWILRHSGRSHLTCDSLIDNNADHRVEYCISVKDIDSDTYLSYIHMTSRCTIGIVNTILSNADYVTHFTVLSIPPTGMWTSRPFRTIAEAVNSNAPGLNVDRRLSRADGKQLPAIFGKFVRLESQ
jgi:hypothetical protein